MTGRARGPSSDRRRDAAPASLPGWVRAAAWFGVFGVTAYIASWLVAGWLVPGYVATDQAISELFAVGAPAGPRALVVAGLAVSGVAFLVLAPALDRALPGRGRLGPVLVAVAGLGTLAIIAAPCTLGCPGVGTTSTDTWHVVWAGVSYVGLTTAPLAVAWRVRTADPVLTRWSWSLGGVSAALLAAYAAGVLPLPGGLQQRTFNTLADVWYLLVARRILASGGHHLDVRTSR